MIFDLQSMFSDAQAITATAPSTNVIDLGATQTPQHAAGPVTRDLGNGSPMPIRIQIVEDFDNLTSLQFDLEVDDDEAFGTAETVQSATVLLADLVAGKVVPPMYTPQGVNKRYVRLNYTVTGTAPAAGKVTAGIVEGHQTWTP